MNTKKSLLNAQEEIKKKNYFAAIHIYQELIKRDPECNEAIGSLSFIYLQNQKIIEAESVLENLLLQKTPYMPMMVNLIKVKYQLKKYDEALSLIDKYKTKLLNSLNNDVVILLIKIYRQKNQAKELFSLIEKINLSREHINAAIFAECGYTLNFFKKYEQALHFYEKALSKDFDLYQTKYNIAITLQNMKRFSEAEIYLEELLQKQPNNIEIIKSLAACLMFLQKYSSAINLLNRTILLFPQEYDLYLKKAFVLIVEGKTGDAIKLYDQIILKEKNYYQAYLAKGFICLSKLDFNSGWDLYRYRQLVDKEKCKTNDFEIERIDLTEKIVIISEQGIGDWIFHFRILNLIKHELKNCILYIDKRLMNIFMQQNKKIKYLNIDDYRNKKNPKDQVINLASVGKYLIKNILDIQRIEKWKIQDNLSMEIKNKIFEKNKINIGISWKSENKEWGDDKSIELSLLEEIIKDKSFNLINLQYGPIENEIKNYKQSIKNTNIDLFDDMDSLASIIKNCDLIITISNVTAHIAGALGKKTYLLLPKHNGKMWYWTKDAQEISIWYPSIEIIGQEKYETWKDSIKKLEAKLTEWKI